MLIQQFIEDITQAYITIDQIHHEMHEGHFYFIKTIATVPAAPPGPGTLYFAFKTPDTTTRIHARATIEAITNPITVTIHEGATDVTGGTPVPGWNVDRDSPRVAELLAYASPTIGVHGADMWVHYLDANRTVTVDIGLGYEIVAKRNTWYEFHLEQASGLATKLNVDFFWYEHTPKTY